mgnify:CR=1 FL=1
MTTYDELYAFLKARYKPSRFEERNDRDYPDYAHCVARGRMAGLARRGYDLISRHESRSGESVVFDTDLNILDGIPRVSRNGARAGRAGGYMRRLRAHHGPILALQRGALRRQRWYAAVGNARPIRLVRSHAASFRALNQATRRARTAALLERTGQ